MIREHVNRKLKNKVIAINCSGCAVYFIGIMIITVFSKINDSTSDIAGIIALSVTVALIILYAIPYHTRKERKRQ